MNFRNPSPSGIVLIALYFVLSHHSFAQIKEVTAIKADALISGTGTVMDGSVTVIIEGDKIVSAGKATQIKIPSNAKVIDLKGHTLLPGFIDTHTHLASIDNDGGDQ